MTWPGLGLRLRLELGWAGAGTEPGPGSRGRRRRKGRCAPRRDTERKCTVPGLPSQLLGQSSRQVSAGVGPVRGAGQWPGERQRGANPKENIPLLPRHRSAYSGTGAASTLFRALASGDSGRGPGAGCRGQAAQQGVQHLLAHGKAPRHMEAACGERRDSRLGGRAKGAA